MKSKTLLPIVAMTIAAVGSTSAQNNWVYFGQDQGATKYSTLAQINTENVSEPEAGVDLPHRRQDRVLREHAARRRQRHVLLRAERRSTPSTR